MNYNNGRRTLFINRSIQNECESTLISGFNYTYYFNGFDYIVEDSSGEKSKMTENAFNALFKVSKESK